MLRQKKKKILQGASTQVLKEIIRIKKARWMTRVIKIALTKRISAPKRISNRNKPICGNEMTAATS